MVQAIVANKIVPGVLDWYLARTDYASQQHDGKANHDQPDNFWRPPDNEWDHGAHGAFDARAQVSSPQLWLGMHRGALVGSPTSAILSAAAIIESDMV